MKEKIKKAWLRLKPYLKKTWRTVADLHLLFDVALVAVVLVQTLV